MKTIQITEDIMNVYYMGDSEKNEWGHRALVAAHDEEEARKIIWWDYNGKTVFCEIKEGLTYTGKPDVIVNYEDR